MLLLTKKDMRRDINMCGLRKDATAWRRETRERKSRWYK